MNSPATFHMTAGEFVTHTPGTSSLEESYPGYEFSGRIIPWVQVLWKNHTLGASSLEESYLGYKFYGRIIPWVRVLWKNHILSTFSMHTLYRSTNSLSLYTHHLSAHTLYLSTNTPCVWREIERGRVCVEGVQRNKVCEDRESDC